jgi:hypothetical protein
MRVRINGPFRVHDDSDIDITPPGMKERALLALLLLSPGQRRTRVWLQDKLWSDRAPEQASGSLRQALSNVRKALGPAGERLKSDRTTLWLSPEVDLGKPDQGELLDDIHVRDPEFTDWLRDERQAREAGPAVPGPGLSLPDRRRAVVILRQSEFGASSRLMFLSRAIAQRIAGDLVLVGEIDVIQLRQGDPAPPDDRATAVVDLETYDESRAGFVLVRVVGMPSRRTAWSGRLALGTSIADVWDAPEATRLVNQTVRKVAELVAASPQMAHQLAFHRAVRRVYEFDRDGLVKADELLAGIQDGEFRGLALAWRGFVRLTAALEFRDSGPDIMAESRAFADDALRVLADHPVVLALASQVRLKLEGDLDTAHYLALRAAEISDQNPYALEALSQTLIMHGKYEEANALAQRARLAAQGMANSFNWDMQACLTAVSLGQLDVALAAALSSHRAMPFYRPALRYLVALSYLTGAHDDALLYAERLRRLEPDFMPQLLLRPDYPLETLRALGRVEDLRKILS